MIGLLRNFAFSANALMNPSLLDDKFEACFTLAVGSKLIYLDRFIVKVSAAFNVIFKLVKPMHDAIFNT